MTAHRPLPVLAIVVLLLGSGLRAQTPAPAGGTQGGKSTPAEAKPNITFDHLKDKTKIFDLTLNDGQKFIVAVANTCPEAFDYSYAGIARGETREQSVAKKALETKTIEVVYDARFGGYVFTIAAKEGKSGADCEGGEKLGPATFIVSVRQQNWNLSFSGGFTISGLTNPVYSLKTENGVKKIVEEPDKRDSQKLGAASFVHLFHDGISWKQIQPALGFGLGINGDSKAEYLIGGAIRLGDRATINIGKAWGSIARLPNGVTKDGPVTDDNILNNLGSQVVSRWFVALTYSFIDTKDRLLKPFAQEEAGGAAAKAAAPSAAVELTDPLVLAIKTAAADQSTYADIKPVKALLDPAGAAKLSICSAAATSSADKKSAAVAVHVKGADANQLTVLKAAEKQAGVAIVAAVKKAASVTVAVSAVTFDAACSQAGSEP